MPLRNSLRTDTDTLLVGDRWPAVLLRSPYISPSLLALHILLLPFLVIY